MLQIHFTCSSRFESGAFFEDFTFLLQENFWTKMMMVDRLDASFVGDLDVDVASHHHADGGGKNSSDEELWGFFENMSKKSTPADVLMEKMKKKNEARLKRLKEIDEDKKKHQ